MFSLKTSSCFDSHLTAERALELACDAIVDDHETATVSDADGNDCTLEGDVDDSTVRLVSPTGEILAIRDVDVDDIDCFLD